MGDHVLCKMDFIRLNMKQKQAIHHKGSDKLFLTPSPFTSICILQCWDISHTYGNILNRKRGANLVFLESWVLMTCFEELGPEEPSQPSEIQPADYSLNSLRRTQHDLTKLD